MGFYWSELRAVAKSLLPLPEGPLHDRVKSRKLEADVGPLDAIIDYTLVWCMRSVGGEREVLLGKKKRGLGVGKWNGFGGKFEVGETALECATRELEEECGLKARCLSWRAQLLFTFRDSGKLMRVHVFEVTSFDGDIVETDEMRPQWFNVTDLPLDDMWADDKIWIPKFLAGDTFQAWFDYHAGGETVNSVADYAIIPVV